MKKKLFIVILIVISMFICVSCKDKEKNINENNTVDTENESKDNKPERIELNNLDIEIINVGRFGETRDWFTKGILNEDKFGTKGEYHLPIRRVQNVDELKEFVEDSWDSDLRYDSKYHYNLVVKKYDEEFFSENEVIFVCINTDSDSYEFDVKEVYYDGETFCAYVHEKNNPELLDHGRMQDWVVAIAVSKDILKNTKEYDAQMVGTYVESFFEKEEKIKWDIPKDQRLKWFTGSHSFYYAYAEYGKIGLDSTANGIKQKVPETKYGERIPLVVEERSGKTCIELYYNYIKPLNVRTEFYGWSDEDIEKEIYDRSPSLFTNQEKPFEYPIGILIFVTRKEFDEMILNGCPEDMMVTISWPYEDFGEFFDRIY